LETVVEQLEQGRLTLADSLMWYETGLALARRCSDLLAAAELRVSTLDATYGSLAEDAAPWDDDET
jgi:exodeoxyribonuclease VII small subunit